MRPLAWAIRLAGRSSWAAGSREKTIAHLLAAGSGCRSAGRAAQQSSGHQQPATPPSSNFATRLSQTGRRGARCAAFLFSAIETDVRSPSPARRMHAPCRNFLYYGIVQYERYPGSQTAAMNEVPLQLDIRATRNQSESRMRLGPCPSRGRCTNH